MTNGFNNCGVEVDFIQHVRAVHLSNAGAFLHQRHLLPNEPVGACSVTFFGRVKLAQVGGQKSHLVTHGPPSGRSRPFGDPGGC